MKTITCLLRLFALMFIAFPAFSDAEVKETPLTIAMSNDSYPFQFVDENNQPSGLLVDIWLEWSKQTNRQVLFKPSNWDTSLKDVEMGGADVHIGMAKTAARVDDYEFSEEIASVTSYLYINYQLPLAHSFADIIPYKVGVVKGAAQIAILKKLQPKLTFIYFDNRSELIKAVINEEVFVFVGLEGFLRQSQVNNIISVNFPVENRKLISALSISPVLKRGNHHQAAMIAKGFSEINPEVIEGHQRRWLGNLRYQNDIVIAMQTDVEPFADIGSDGLPHGLLVDIWKLWSEKTGLPIRFVAGSMKQSIDNIKRGIADVHLGYPESAAMQTGLNRTHTIYRVASRLFSFEKPLQSLDDLKGKVVAVAPTAPYLPELVDALPDSDIRYYHSVDSMIEAAKSGEISAFVAAAAWTQHYLLLNHSWEQFHQYMDLEFKTDLFVLNRGSEQGFAQRVAAGFNLITQGELASIERKWMLNPEDRIYKNKRGLIDLTPVQQRLIEDVGTVKVGYLRNWRPMEYQQEGQYGGINSDIVNIIAEELGLNIQTQVFDEWQDLLDALISGEVDMAGSVAKTPEREFQLSFTDSYWPAPWGLVTSFNHVNVFSLDDLKGQRVAVVEGYHIISQLMREHPRLKLILVPDSQAGLKAVEQGKADVFIDKVVNLSSNLRNDKFANLKMSMLVGFAQQRSHFGVHHSKKELLPLINAVLANIDSTRQQQIHQKWVSQTVEFGRDEYENKLKMGIVAFSILTLVIIVALLAIRRLRKEVALRIEAENKMAHFAKHDALTQLPNRMLIEDRLEQAILLHARDTAQFAVIFIDLDGFKLINDKYGHQVGDKFLVHVSEVLANSIRRSDTVGRLGGDEFVVILNDIKDVKSVYDVTENLLSNLSTPFVINEQSVSASASIGIAVYPKDGDCIDALLKTADKQMYRAKNAGGRAYRST